jgi:hypothetical protein
MITWSSGESILVGGGGGRWKEYERRKGCEGRNMKEGILKEGRDMKEGILKEGTLKEGRDMKEGRKEGI